jgi:CBS domain-containing protein
MSAAQRKLGITARDLIRHPTDAGPGRQEAASHPGPISLTTPLEEIVPLLQAAAAEGLDVVDEQGRLTGTITREDAIGALSRTIEEILEERRVLELALERQRMALDALAARIGQIREILDLSEELSRGSTDPGPALARTLAEIRRSLGEPERR